MSGDGKIEYVEDAVTGAGRFRTASEMGPVDKTVREQVLDKARQMVAEDRQEVYGDPGRTLERIAGLWDVYLGGDLERSLKATDVAAMLALLKIARFRANPTHLDNAIDWIGYGAIAAELASKADHGKT